MAKYRHEVEDLLTINDLINSDVVPRNNDKVYVSETNGLYDYDSTATDAHDGDLIIEQNGFVGRWLKVNIGGKSLNQDFIATEGQTQWTLPTASTSVVVHRNGVKIQYLIQCLMVAHQSLMQMM